MTEVRGMFACIRPEAKSFFGMICKVDYGFCNLFYIPRFYHNAVKSIGY